MASLRWTGKIAGSLHSSRAQELGMRITIPMTALTQAIRNLARQVLVSRLIRQAGADLVALDGPDTTAVGL
jgi:hypothetical protein